MNHIAPPLEEGRRYVYLDSYEDNWIGYIEDGKFLVNGKVICSSPIPNVLLSIVTGLDLKQFKRKARKETDNLKEMTLEEMVNKYGRANGTLLGCDSHPFSIVARVQTCLHNANWPREAISRIRREMLSGSHDKVLRVGTLVLTGEEQ